MAVKNYVETKQLLAEIENIHTNRVGEHGLLVIVEPSMVAANKFRADLVDIFKEVNQELVLANKPEKNNARKAITKAFRGKKVPNDDGERIQEAAAYMNRELTNLIQAAKDQNGKFRIPEHVYNKKLAEILNKGMEMMPQGNVANPTYARELQKIKTEIQQLKSPIEKPRQHPGKY